MLNNPEREILVLFVEDDRTSLTLLEVILAGMNFKIICAHNGVEAVRYFQENPEIELILMDIKMPEMDGIEATKEIRKLNPSVPIIAQTAYALSGDREKALEAGCNDYITKPLNKTELLKKVKEQLKL